MRRPWAFVCGVVVCLAVLAALLTRLGSPRPLQPAAAERLVHEANLALAHLENQQFPEAAIRLSGIAAALPADPFVIRNQAVLAVLRLAERDPTGPDQSATLQTLASLRRQEGEHAAYHWLSATAALATEQPEQAAGHFAALIATEPGDAAAHYGLWIATNRQATGDTSASLAPLEKACELAPGNIWLALEWMRASALRVLARPPATAAEAIAFADALRTRAAAVLPFAPLVQMAARVDVEKLLADCRAAAEAHEWNDLARGLRMLANLVAPQSGGDRRAVERHPLEFVIDSLSPALLDAAGLVARAAPVAIPVSFAAFDGSTPGLDPDQATDVVGILLEDFDVDGRIDAAICTADRLVLHAASPAGWSPLAATDLPPGTRGLLAVDIDLDFDEARRQRQPDNATQPADRSTPSAGCPAADLDLVTFGDRGVVLWQNRLATGGSRSLEEAEWSLPVTTGTVTAVTPADLDADGRIDLVVADATGLHVWINRGSLGFEERSPPAVREPMPLPVVGLMAIDWDGDIDVDLLVGTASGVMLLENLRHGAFRGRSLVQVSSPLHALEILDADADGSWDIVLADADGVRLHRFVAGPAAPPDVVPISSAVSLGLSVFDYDNDGWLDIACRTASGLDLGRGLPGSYGPLWGVAVAAGVLACDAADLDGDGDLDLGLATTDGLQLLENLGGNANHWLAIDLEAQQVKAAETSPSGRVNAHGLGSLIELRAGTMHQRRSVRRRTTHFGLGAERGTAGSVDAVRIVWLNGVPQNLLSPPPDLLICEQQVLLGSCPYVYGWNGREHVFITDLLWAAPLGLQWSEGQTLPARPWEYLKLPGESLVSRDGCYELRITEELWEAAYFDEVRLLAVDHPPDVEIFSNEKVGPADLARFRVHTVRQPLPPRSARDHRGQDVLRQIRSADGIYPEITAGKLRQGRVAAHALELDLGPAVDPDNVTLFLTGWTYPTTVGLNLALARDPSLGLPAPPSLAVPDGNGGWNTVLPFMGFPGGKTKTIAVDVSGLIVPDDPRVRIETSMEIHWDQAFFTSGEPSAELEITPLPLLSADLHYRGFSRVERDASDGPERFDYRDLSTAAKWPPMDGPFTRFGDVAPLLETSDDRLVVMAAGDEMTLRFRDSPGPPGWKRDFLLKSVGWDKDANLATIEGQSSEPLPFGALQKTESRGPRPLPPDTPAYRRYLQQYQTRRQPAGFWNQFRRGMSWEETATSSSSAP
jgi:hypothetical protein